MRTAAVAAYLLAGCALAGAAVSNRTVDCPDDRRPTWSELTFDVVTWPVMLSRAVTDVAFDRPYRCEGDLR